MNNGSKPLLWLRRLLPFLLVLAGVKLLWVLVELLFLPTRGVEPPSVQRRSLYQPYRLASNETLQAPRPEPRPRTMEAIRNMKLLGIYAGPQHQIAIIAKGRKNYVVARGESVLGYHIEAVEDDAVVLSRGGKEYRLELARKSTIGKRPSLPASEESPDNAPASIRDEGETRIVSRSLIDSYVKDLDKIWKNIGIVPYREGNALRGFKVRFVRRGSDFEKLGLRRGDIITGINGEPLTDYATPMRLLKNVDMLKGLLLQIRRGNQELEIEYEVR